MFLKCLKSACFGVLLLFLCVSVYAAATEPKVNDSYSIELEQAKNAYNEGEYLKAKQIFEHVLAQTLLHEKPGASIYYNLGAVCYKLKQYDESKSYFSKLITHPTMEAVAYYNLALIENKLSRKKSTLDYLHKSKNASTDKKL